MTRRARPAHGLSIIELMIGIAISLFVLAAATMVTTAQLGDNRRMLIEAQVQQDMRTMTDIVTNDLRRAGYWAQAFRAVWPGTAVAASNPYFTLTPSNAASATQIEFTRSRDEEAANAVTIISENNSQADAADQAGFMFDSANKVVKAKLGDGAYYDLNDPRVLEVTDFRIRISSTNLPVPCGATCRLNDAGNPLSLAVRTATVTIVGRSAIDHSVVRSVSYNLRLRNDWIN